MTARKAASLITSWKDWLVIASLAVNLLFVGSMYGDMRATQARTVVDIRDLTTRLDNETKTRADEDNRLEDRILEVCRNAAPAGRAPTYPSRNTMTTALQGPLYAPFPYFGGKRTVAADVWSRFGDVPNYIEPFAGSLAVLLGRPHRPRTETVNDLDGLVCNFWRAVTADPAAVARFASGPVVENDLHARHAWLVARKDRLQERLEGDPEYHDVRVAGWWVWGISLWIGSGWCSGRGPWSVEDGRLVKGESAGAGVHRKLPALSGDGRGVFRQLPNLGSGRNPVSPSGLKDAFGLLSERLQRVRVACGTWSRIVTPSVTVRRGLTAVFLDPPYSAPRDANLYRIDDATVAVAAREWAVQNGDDKRFRIALCGYEGEHAMPETWTKFAWKARGGYASQGHGRARENASKERIWFSPHCLKFTS